MRLSLLLLPFLLACKDKGTDTGADGDGGDDAVDLDGDGFAGLDDCDDGDATVNPAATELCDGVDNDCDGEVDEADAGDTITWYSDADGDGQGDPATAQAACAQPAGTVDNMDDCDDGDDAVYLGADEWCDGVDNDCDDVVDEDDALDAPTWYLDDDGDGFGDPDASVLACAAPDDHTADATDCDDADDAVNPGAAEVCDGADNDCDEEVDEDEAVDALAWYGDGDGDGWGASDAVSWACEQPEGTSPASGDCDDAADAVNPGATEVCDEIDNDCDGTVDEDDAADASTWYADRDGDGWGDAADTALACATPSGYTAAPGDCDDAVATTNPGATETCNEVDDDCDATVDEDDAADAPTWYSDVDGDGYGDPSSGAAACSAPEGTVADGSDCDDGNSDAFPGGEEVCDEADNDCNGTVDDDSATDAPTWYEDADEDGYGLASSSARACSQPLGYVSDDSDCDDDSDAAYPGGTEVCDSLDNDCDGTADEPDATDAKVLYLDSDLDGYGVSSTSVRSCSSLSTFSEEAGDCDNSDASIYPGAPEVPQDGIDQDCDGDDAPYSVTDLGEGDLLITEIMQNPVKVDDAYGEWFEVLNRSGGQVDLDGLYVYDLGTDRFTVSGELLVEADEYVVFGRRTDTTVNGGAPVDYAYGTAFAMSNTDDEVYLSESSAKAVVFDGVGYDGGPEFPDPSGYSMSLDPELYDHELNDEGEAWCTASSTYGLGDYGTPGDLNDVCGE